jgi:hypothetical protein
MGYAILIGGLLAVSAVALEWGFRAYRRPTRWIWMAAIVLAILGPLAAMIAGGASGSVESRTESLGTGALEEATSYLTWPSAVLRFDDPSSLSRLDRPLVMAWLIASMLLAARYGVSLAVLAQRRRDWRVDEVDDVPVRMAPDIGPAVVGFFAPAIVLPEWIRTLDSHLLRLVVAHEQEHVRAWDSRFMLAAGAPAVLFPWNLPLWWQVRRLRLAIEIDCDRRVLDGGGEIAPYAGLLCELGAMRGRSRLESMVLGQSALIRPAAFLERRIRHITGHLPRHRPWKALGVGTLAIVLLGFATVPEPPTASAPKSEIEYQILVADIEYWDAESVTQLPPVDVLVPSQDGRPERRWHETYEAYENMMIVDRQMITREQVCYTTREPDGSMRMRTHSVIPEIDSLMRLPDNTAVSRFLSDQNGGKEVNYIGSTVQDRAVCFLLRGEIQGLEPSTLLGPETSSGAIKGFPRDTTDFRSVRIRCQAGCYPVDIRRFFEARVGRVACNVLVGLRIDPSGHVSRVDIFESGAVPICNTVAEQWARSTRWSLSRNIEDWPFPVSIIQQIRYSPLES